MSPRPVLAMLTSKPKRMVGIFRETVLEINSAGKREVLELSTTPLDHSLFEIPRGFEKVEVLPGRPPGMSSEQRMDWEWTQLANAVQSWFR